MELSPRLLTWKLTSAVAGAVHFKRYSMLIDDGAVKAVNVEAEGTGLTRSLAKIILSQL